MGWLYMQSLDGHCGPKQYLDAQFTYARPEVTSKVLRSALAGMRVYYAAVEHIRLDTGQRDVFAVVCLVRYNPRDKEGYIFGYKQMDETMGPCESDCPASILDLLTPIDAKCALDALPRESRRSSRARGQTRTARRAGDRLRRGLAFFQWAEF